MFRNPAYQYNFYEILEVSPAATSGVIEAAYKALVKKYHPDLNAGISDHKIKLLNMAKEILLDDSKRKDYDSAMNFNHHKPKFTSDYNSTHSLSIENEKLKNEIRALHKKIENLKSQPADDGNVFVICTNCGTKNRLPDLSYLNMQSIKCGLCKLPFGTGNRDFEKERDLKEKASAMKKTADVEWRRVSANINKIEYNRIESLLNKYTEIQQVYPRVYGIKTKLKSLKDELLLRNSNIVVMRKIAMECSDELSKYKSGGIFGLFKNEKVINDVKEKLSGELLMYPKLSEEKLTFNCRSCEAKNVVKISLFVANHENILCGHCHVNLFK
ncbi:MAG: Chaperone protein DnaJ [bacterium ADurb.Bin243]|nr:MAG: Chaperone protein DnaJ [bacterium ADurb.Bin243]